MIFPKFSARLGGLLSFDVNSMPTAQATDRSCEHGHQHRRCRDLQYFNCIDDTRTRPKSQAQQGKVAHKCQCHGDEYRGDPALIWRRIEPYGDEANNWSNKNHQQPNPAKARLQTRYYREDPSQFRLAEW